MPARPDSRGLLARVLLALLGFGLAGFLLWLLGQRVGSGDVYPEYSSLRADPMGTKALFLAIDALPGKHAERNLRAWHRAKPGDPATVLCLGSGLRAMRGLPLKDQQALLGWLRQGHRVVLTLPPASAREQRADRRARKEKEDKEIGKDAKPPQDREKKPGADDADKKPVKKETPGAEAETAEKAKDPMLLEPGFFGLECTLLPSGEHPSVFRSDSFPPVPWRGSYALDIKDSAAGWKTEATVDGRPVLASRRIGAGELLVFADTTFASNQGVWQDRSTPFILALIGDKPRVVFDERLLGTGEDPGVMTLVRQLGLQGLLIGGAVVMLLLVWQGLSPLVPANPDKDMGIDADGSTGGRDAADGLVALLQRGLPPGRVLTDGLARWEHTRGNAPATSPADLIQAREIAAAARPGHLAGAYRAIRDLLNRPQPKSRHHHGSP